MPEIIFNGLAGRLQGRYRQGHSKAPIVVLMHPHSVFGGSMDNQIIHKLYYLFHEMGFTTLRFNFRGIGKSEGEYDFGVGELADAADALTWAQNFITNYNSCWVAGYSFGAWIAMQLMMRRPEIKGFITISPPKQYDFGFLAPCPANGLIVCGENDQVADPNKVRDLVSDLKKQGSVEIVEKFIEGADHFYNNKVSELMDVCKEYIEYRLKSDLKNAESLKLL